MLSVFLRLRPVLGLLGKVVPVVLRHPFAVRATSWSLLLVVLLVAVVAGLEVAAPIEVLVGIGLLIAVPLIALYSRRRLVRPGERPVLFLSQFVPETPGATEASLNHQVALHERLATGLLPSFLELRDLPAAVTSREAQNLLAESGARGVVFGRVRAISSAANWTAVMLHTGSSWGEEEAAPDHVEENQRTRLTTATRHEFEPDLKRPLAELLDARLEADHANSLEATLLALLAQDLLFEGQGDDARRCLEEADRGRAALTLKARAHLEISRFVLDATTDVRSALMYLRRAGEQDTDHVDLWKAATIVAFGSLDAGEVQPDEVVALAERSLRAAPNDAEAHALLGTAYAHVGRAPEAIREFAVIDDEPRYASSFDFHMERGVLLFNLDRFEEAQAAYAHAVALDPTARAHLYLADTHLRLDQITDARRHYREALLLQPDLADAHRGYWWKVPPGEEAREAWFDRAFLAVSSFPGRRKRWRRVLVTALLRWHYRRHPEDSRIHYMLGMNALFRGRFAEADDRLTFAYELLDGLDLEALARRAIARSHLGQYEAARQDLETLRAAPGPHEVASGKTASRARTLNELSQRAQWIVISLVEETRLLGGAGGWRFQQMMLEVFPDVFARPPEEWVSGLPPRP
ncbi:MAG: hypothetical protein QOI91_1830 [Solirubrobacteraceae bacterium]|nr:hypothetical protein [Solirubrobacteraceae bacterium]